MSEPSAMITGVPPSRWNPRHDDWDWIRPTYYEKAGIDGPRWQARCKRCSDWVYGEDVAEVRALMERHDADAHPPSH